MPERPLQHREPDNKDDETLKREARAHLASEPALQLAAELIARLREIDVPWWSAARLRERWGSVERMRWFRERPDLRQHITTSLTGLAPRAARRKTPDFQGALIDSVIDEADITPRAFEDAFDPCDLAVYGPASAYWHFFRESMPWDKDTQVHQELVAWLLKSLLADRSPFDGIGRAPILTPWDVRTAIDGRVWHTRIPLEIRVAIDDARLQQERDRPGVPFHADGDLAIAAPEIIAASIPLRELVPVLVVAQKSMRFDPPRTAAKLDNGKGMVSDVPPRPHELVSPSSLPGPPGAPLGMYEAVGSKAPQPPPMMTPPGAALMPPPMVAPGSPQAGHGPPPSGGHGGPPPGHGGAPPSGHGGQPPSGHGGAPPSGHSGAPPSGHGGAPPSGHGGPPPSGHGPASHGAQGGPPAGHGPASAPPSASAATAAQAPGTAAGPASAGAPASAGPPKSGPDGIAPPPMVDPTRMAPLPPPTPEINIAGQQRAPRSTPPAAGASAVLAVLNSIESSEDDLESTNPWTVPTPEEIAAESARLPPEGTPEATGKRRRPKA